MQGFTAPTAGGATSYSRSYCGTNHLVEWHLLADVNTTVWSLGRHLMVTQPEWLYIIALIQSIIKLSSKWLTARLEVKPVTALCERLSSSLSLSLQHCPCHSFALIPLNPSYSLILSFTHFRFHFFSSLASVGGSSGPCSCQVDLQQPNYPPPLAPPPPNPIHLKYSGNKSRQREMQPYKLLQRKELTKYSAGLWPFFGSWHCRERDTRRRLPNVVKPAWLTATPNYEFLEVKWHLRRIKTAWERGINCDRQKTKAADQ